LIFYSIVEVLEGVQDAAINGQMHSDNKWYP
jgi:hypothetical protein